MNVINMVKSLHVAVSFRIIKNIHTGENLRQPNK